MFGRTRRLLKLLGTHKIFNPCLNRLYTDCLYLDIDSISESLVGDLFVK